MDSWFTSVPLVDELLQLPYNLMRLGTIRKKEMPPQIMKNKSKRPTGDIKFCFAAPKILLGYKPKPNKVVCIISTMHQGASVLPNRKPTVIQDYNQTKGGVDGFDQVSSTISISQRTKCWPMCMFYGMMNMACINTYVIYNTNLINNKNDALTQNEFMHELYKALIYPWLEVRLQRPTQQRCLKIMLNSVLGRS